MKVVKVKLVLEIKSRNNHGHWKPAGVSHRNKSADLEGAKAFWESRGFRTRGRIARATEAIENEVQQVRKLQKVLQKKGG